MQKLPPLRALQAFEAVARHRSFKAAAAELNVTPTAISHQIRMLEQICGKALLQRRPRPLRLTVAGSGSIRRCAAVSRCLPRPWRPLGSPVWHARCA
jgi:DNA-binding transcriptional LysR family regulator